MLHCFKGCADLGHGYLRALAEEVSALDRNGRPSGQVLKADPWSYLEERGLHLTKPKGEPARLPSDADLEAMAEALLSGGPPLDYLLGRGLTLPVIDAAGIGWDSERGVLVFPLRWGGEVVNYKTRKPKAGAKMYASIGRKKKEGHFPLFPEPCGTGGTLLVEGELDACRAQSAGIPATSITTGKSGWYPGWIDQLAGREVAVCFDVGAEAAVQKAVERLRSGSIRAYRLDLRQLGLTEDKADLTDYLNGGGTPEKLRKAALRARREAA